MGVARRWPWGWCPWGSRDAARRDAAGGAAGCGMLLSSRASRAPGSSSVQPTSALWAGGEENSETLFRSEVCLSLYLDAAPLLNLVSPH